MGQVFDLTTDSREIGGIAAMRVMVSSALLYTFTVPFLVLRLTMFSSQSHISSARMLRRPLFSTWEGD